MSCVESPVCPENKGSFPQSQHPSLWQLQSSLLPLPGYLGGPESLLGKRHGSGYPAAILGKIIHLKNGEAETERASSGHSGERLGR